MAATNFTPISLYYSATAASVPTAGNLVAGELALNTADGKLFYKDSAGVVQILGTKGGVGTSSNTQVLYNSSGLVVGSSNFVFDGTNVGIGITNPSSYSSAANDLVVGSASGSNGITIRAQNDSLSVLAFSDGTGGTENLVGYCIYDHSSNAMRFGANDSERMRIDSSGNVGIGTSSPTAKLYVSAPSGTAPLTLDTAGGSDTTRALNFNVAGDNYGKILVPSGSGGAMAFWTGGANAAAERMRIDTSGNLLVGTTSTQASSKFLVSIIPGTTTGYATLPTTATGYTAATFLNSVAAGIGSITTTTVATLFNTTSDYRLKTVIGNVTNSGQRIDALEPIEYDWNEGGRTRGFLAHKFAEIYPNSVTGEKDAIDKDGKPVYQGMQASTPEVMADLIAEIQSLRKRVAQLESK